jgi:hypothetical protein
MNNSINHQSADDDMVNYNGGDPEEELSYLVDGSLDHALLESLFYNEMALLSSGSHTYGDESLFASASNGSTDSHLSPPSVPSSGNGGFSFLEQGETDGIPPASQMETLPIYENTAAVAAMVAPSLAQMNYQPVTAQYAAIGSLPMVNTSSFRVADPTNNISLSAHHALQNPLDHAATPVYPSPQPLPPSFGGISSTVVPPSGLPVPVQLPVARGGIRHNVVAVLDQDGRTQLPIKTTDAPNAEEEKRKKLVAQFATLAGRLGITLPPQVLEKLTNKASSNTSTSDASVALDATALTGTLPVMTTSGMEVDAAQSQQPELLKQLQTTAAEAIAAVNHKRAAVAPTIETTASATDKPYSKRRKKPRLSECEQKLQELQSENAILKRHLDNIANRNARLDQERIKAETQMRQLLEENAPDAVLDPIVKNFTEMYSDYGRKRHDELNFHLQQLKRLANPTNFTKMGLWTLGGGVHASSSSPSNADGGATKLGSSNGGTSGNGSSGTKNPIAGMLQRELGISALQGRKILEQRQKIQNVCSNLKEVRIVGRCSFR